MWNECQMEEPMTDYVREGNLQRKMDSLRAVLNSFCFIADQGFFFGGGGGADRGTCPKLGTLVPLSFEFLDVWVSKSEWTALFIEANVMYIP